MEIKTVKLDIKGMTCDHCEATVAKAIQGDGIIDKKVSYENGNAIVSYDTGTLNAEDISQLVNGTGHYNVTGYKEEKGENNQGNHFVIIGGGSAAFAATIQARELGARVTMINDGLPIGGTCVNVGCVPSKYIIRAAEALHKSNNIPFAGIKGEGKVTDFSHIIGQKTDLVEQLRQEKYIDVVSDMENFRRIKGRALFTGPKTVEVNGETITGDHFLIATGARTNIPDINGLKDVPFLTNETAFALEKLPESMIVLGGRYIALEIAQMFSRLGTKVTILQRSDRILPSEAVDITNGLTEYFKDEGINIVTGNDLEKISYENENFTVNTLVDGTSTTYRAEQLVVATGRAPNTGSMGLDKAGVDIDSKGFVVVDEKLNTSQSHIFAAGDVLGQNMFVYTAAYEGKLAASNALSSLPKNRNYTALPWVVFTDPQVAGVGMDEAMAEDAGIDYDVAKLELSHIPRSIAAMDTRGFIKLLRDRASNRLIGARILAPEGSELLMEVAMAIKFEITSDQLREMFHPYLTLSEGVKLAAITFDKSVAELSCCAT